MELPMMLAQAVALSLAGEADARLKYSVTTRQQRYRHHPTTKQSMSNTKKQPTWNDNTLANLKWVLRDLLEMVILAFR